MPRLVSRKHPAFAHLTDSTAVTEIENVDSSFVARNRLAMSKSIELDAVRPVCGAPFSALALAR